MCVYMVRATRALVLKSCLHDKHAIFSYILYLGTGVCLGVLLRLMAKLSPF